MIEREEKSVATTSSVTKNQVFGDITVDVLKRVFKIDPSLTTNTGQLQQIANILNYRMPGANLMLSDFVKYGKSITLVYDDNIPYPYYGKYKNVLGYSIVLNSINFGQICVEAVLEEFFHAYWALFMTNNGGITAAQEFEAQLEAKIYTSFVMSAEKAIKMDSTLEKRHAVVYGPIGLYEETRTLYHEGFLDDFYNYFRPGGSKVKYDMSDELYRKLYDAYARDSEQPWKVGGYLTYNSKWIIFHLLNNRFYYGE